MTKTIKKTGCRKLQIPKVLYMQCIVLQFCEITRTSVCENEEVTMGK
jgi:hypothetical protein